MSDALSLIGLPYQFGRRADGRGYQMAAGPEVLLDASAVPAALASVGWDTDVVWLGDLDDPTSSHADGIPAPPGDQMIRQQYQNTALAGAVRAARGAGRTPVCFSGGCNSSIGVVAGLTDTRLGMFWFDAHSDDMTPETSVDGLFEGMPVSVIAGESWQLWASRIEGFTPIPADRIAQIGLHDGAFRSGVTRRLGVGSLVDPVAVGTWGFEDAFQRAADQVTLRSDGAYVHIDTDVISAEVLRANLHAAPGGLTPEQLVWAVGQIAARCEILALNFTAYDTAVDPNAPAVLVPLVRDVVEAAIGGARRDRS